MSLKDVLDEITQKLEIIKLILGGPVVGRPAIGRPAIGRPAVGEPAIEVLNIPKNLQGNIKVPLMFVKDNIFNIKLFLLKNNISYNDLEHIVTHLNNKYKIAETILYWCIINTSNLYINSFNIHKYDGTMKNTSKFNYILNSIIYIDASTSFIHCPITFERYNEMNPKNIAFKVTTKLTDYKGIIGIRGDGRCYYRAIIVSLLTSILYDQQYNKEQKNYYILKLIKVFNEYPKVIEFLRKLLIETDVLHFIYFIKEYTPYNNDIIEALKDILIKYLANNLDVKIKGEYTIREQISLFLYLVANKPINFEMFCSVQILDNNEYAEGFYVNQGILPKCLLCNKSNLYMKIITGYTNIDQSFNTIQENDLPTIHIVFVPGHYDVFIPKTVL